jgi:hypothetical protein
LWADFGFAAGCSAIAPCGFGHGEAVWRQNVRQKMVKCVAKVDKLPNPPEKRFFGGGGIALSLQELQIGVGFAYSGAGQFVTGIGT